MNGRTRAMLDRTGGSKSNRHKQVLLAAKALEASRTGSHGAGGFHGTIPKLGRGSAGRVFRRDMLGRFN